MGISLPAIHCPLCRSKWQGVMSWAKANINPNSKNKKGEIIETLIQRRVKKAKAKRRKIRISGEGKNNGGTWGYLDYLTEEIRTTFRLGKQVWECGEREHLTQRQLIADAIARARIRYELSQKEIKKEA